MPRHGAQPVRAAIHHDTPAHIDRQHGAMPVVAAVLDLKIGARAEKDVLLGPGQLVASSPTAQFAMMTETRIMVRFCCNSGR